MPCTPARRTFGAAAAAYKPAAPPTNHGGTRAPTSLCAARMECPPGTAVRHGRPLPTPPEPVPPEVLRNITVPESFKSCTHSPLRSRPPPAASHNTTNTS
ncbi:hypothetical protein BST61_g7960 [Cercospora zeina]